MDAEETLVQSILDCRGLHPPEPLVRILSAVDTMSESDVIEAWLDRRPLMLFAELDERGFAYRCSRRSDGTYTVRIAATEARFLEE
jgi:tRNA 2-thiouridine synthesizing protein A